MAMRKSVRRELYKLRELTWHFLEGEKCYFCKKLLIPDEEIPREWFGRAAAPPMIVPVTIHHIDEQNNPRNQHISNRSLAHQTCHKRHTAQLTRPCDKRKSVIAIRKVA